MAHSRKIRVIMPLKNVPGHIDKERTALTWCLPGHTPNRKCCVSKRRVVHDVARENVPCLFRCALPGRQLQRRPAFMNFLAHIYLSNPAPQAMAGNLLADMVKGPGVLAALPPLVREGVLWHRAVDAFTDSHPIVAASCARLGPEWARTAPILIDLFHDHVLARDWDRYCGVPLRGFLDDCYRALRSCSGSLPPALQGWLDRIVVSDVMMAYARPEGLKRALARTDVARSRSGRLRLEPGFDALMLHEKRLTADFHVFFPELCRFVGTMPSRAQDQTS